MTPNWYVGLAILVTLVLSGYMGFYLGYRRGYHQGYWTAFISEKKHKTDDQ